MNKKEIFNKNSAFATYLICGLVSTIFLISDFLFMFLPFYFRFYFDGIITLLIIVTFFVAYIMLLRLLSMVNPFKTVWKKIQLFIPILNSEIIYSLLLNLNFTKIHRTRRLIKLRFILFYCGLISSILYIFLRAEDYNDVYIFFLIGISFFALSNFLMAHIISRIKFNSLDDEINNIGKQ